jgi:membrane protein implicated in regulation of membrane protease activity
MSEAGLFGLLAPWLADPWVWAALGVAFMLAELALPGFLMLGFGLGALGMAAAVAFLAAERLGVLGLALVWAGASLVAWIVLSRFFGRGSRRGDEQDINDFKNH